MSDPARPRTPEAPRAPVRARRHLAAWSGRCLRGRGRHRPRAVRSRSGRPCPGRDRVALPADHRRAGPGRLRRHRPPHRLGGPLRVGRRRRSSGPVRPRAGRVAGNRRPGRRTRTAVRHRRLARHRRSRRRPPALPATPPARRGRRTPTGRCRSGGHNTVRAVVHPGVRDAVHPGSGHRVRWRVRPGVRDTVRPRLLQADAVHTTRPARTALGSARGGPGPSDHRCPDLPHGARSVADRAGPHGAGRGVARHRRRRPGRAATEADPPSTS